MKLFEAKEEKTEKKTSTESSYDAQSIEVLKGLDPVKRRPGMYTDTTSPDHLAFEVIDNSVDEAIAGFASAIDVTLTRDTGSVYQTTAGACLWISIPKKASQVWN